MVWWPRAKDRVDAYWPDDDTWLTATVAAINADGTLGIAWADDGSLSDVPLDYERRPLGGSLRHWKRESSASTPALTWSHSQWRPMDVGELQLTAWPGGSPPRSRRIEQWRLPRCIKALRRYSSARKLTRSAPPLAERRRADEE
jgi:hypothetical protein